MRDRTEMIGLKEIEEMMSQVLLYIEENVTEKLTAKEIAEIVYLSPTHLQREFESMFGFSLAEYIRKQKLKRSMDLLLESDLQVSDIAYEIGFGHESSFIRAFKREYGKTPGEVRREGRQLWKQDEK